MVAYTEPQHMKNEESEQLRGERDQIKFIDLRSPNSPHGFISSFILHSEKHNILSAQGTSGPSVTQVDSGLALSL